MTYEEFWKDLDAKKDDEIKPPVDIALEDETKYSEAIETVMTETFDDKYLQQIGRGTRIRIINLRLAAYGLINH